MGSFAGHEVDQPGLLTGAQGSRIVLLATSVEPTWNRAFLLSQEVWLGEGVATWCRTAKQPAKRPASWFQIGDLMADDKVTEFDLDVQNVGASIVFDPKGGQVKVDAYQTKGPCGTPNPPPTHIYIQITENLKYDLDLNK